MERSRKDEHTRTTHTDRTSRWRSGRLLLHRDFRLLWAGDGISQFGTMVTVLAVPLVAVNTLSASAFEVGLLTACQWLAFLVVGLPAGAWVDRMPRRPVMIIADVGRAMVLATIPVAALLDGLTLGHLYAVALVHGLLTVFFDVSYQSYLPSLVGRENLVEGNAKLQGTQSVAKLAGPSLGGLLVQWLTAPYALAATTGSFLCSAGFLSAIRHRETAQAPANRRSMRREIREGLAFVLRHPLLHRIAACTGIANLFLGGAVIMTLLPLFLARELGLSAGVIGLLFSASACGGLVGALFARRVAERIGQGPTLWVSLAVTTPFGLVTPFAEANWSLALVVGGNLVTGAGAVVYNVTQVSFRQNLCPERLLGRMNATMRFLVWGAIPLGGLIGGTLGSLLGVRPAMFLCLLAAGLAFLPAYLSPLRTLRTLPTSPDDDDRAGADQAPAVPTG